MAVFEMLRRMLERRGCTKESEAVADLIEWLHKLVVETEMAA
jgi:hypothetical protein